MSVPPSTLSAPVGPRDASAAATAAPWLSILVPVYNVVDYLRETLESVLSQIEALGPDAEGVELIAANDASTDGSDALLRRIAVEHPRLRCLFLPRNGGLSATRNAMMEVATGRYLWFLDSDDLLLPGALAGLRRVVERESPDLVLCDFSRVREHRRPWWRVRDDDHVTSFDGPSRTRIEDRSLALEGLFRAGQMHAWSKIATRAAWGGLRFPVGRYFEDMSTSPRLMLRCRTVWHEPAVWVGYRQRAGSILATPDARKADHLAHALDGVHDDAVDLPLTRAAQLAWGHMAARNFIGASRMVDEIAPGRCGTDVERFRHALDVASPLDAGALMRRYLLVGWWWRALRLRHWLRRGRADGPSLLETPLKD